MYKTLLTLTRVWKSNGSIKQMHIYLQLSIVIKTVVTQTVKVCSIDRKTGAEKCMHACGS